jgi:hypothetical protein
MISRPIQGSNNVSVPSSETQSDETAVKEQGMSAPQVKAEDKFEAAANQIGSFYDLLISSYKAPEPKKPETE